MRERWRSDLAIWADSFRWGAAQVGTQFVAQFRGGRYPTGRFVLFALGIVILSLPFLLSGSGGGRWLAIGLPSLWMDWRHEWFWMEFEMAFRSSPTIPRDERVALRAIELGRRWRAVEVVATDRRVCWGPRSLQDGHLTNGLTDRTEIEFREISRVERADDEIRIWTWTDTYSIRFRPLVNRRGHTAGEWFSYLEQICPGAVCSVRAPEVIRNSRLLKPTIVAAIVLMAGIPYTAFAVIAARGAGWL